MSGIFEKNVRKGNVGDGENGLKIGFWNVSGLKNKEEASW